MTLFKPNGQLLPLSQFRAALEAGADPNECWQSSDGEQTHYLLLVAAQRHIQHLRLLLAHPQIDIAAKGRDGSTALIVAAKYNHVQAIGPLIRAGVPVNQADRFGATPLHYAVHMDGVGPLRQLLLAGANPNARGGYGRTPLGELMMIMTADETGQALKVRALMEHGADPMMVSVHQRTETMINLARERLSRHIHPIPRVSELAHERRM